MKKQTFAKVLLTLSLLVLQMVHCTPFVMADPLGVQYEEVTNYNELVAAMQETEDGDVIRIAGKIIIPANTSLGNPDKRLTFQRIDTAEFSCFEMLSSEGSSSISNITFDGSSIYGGTYVVTSGDISFNDCHFINCYTTLGGGSVCIRSGNAAFNDCIFDNNRASIGGHILASGNKLQIKNCVLKNGCADYRGGAIQTDTQTCIIDSSDIFNNEATEGGGGINNYSIMTIKNSRIYNNVSGANAADYLGIAPASLRLNDSFNQSVALFEEIGMTALGWFYDYPVGRIETGTMRASEAVTNVPVMLKFKVQKNETSSPSITLSEDDVAVSSDTSSTLYIAEYENKGGNLTNLTWHNILEGSTDEKFNLPMNFNFIKVMLWKADSMIPLCNAKEITQEHTVID